MGDTSFDLSETMERMRLRNEELRAAHDRRQDSLSAQKAGDFCPDRPASCTGFVLVDEEETQCPYEGAERATSRPWELEEFQAAPDLCPHWAARQKNARESALSNIDFALRWDPATWAGLAPEIKKTMLIYCQTLRARLVKGHGLIISGGVGGGKTSALALIAHAFVANTALGDAGRGGLLYVEAAQLTEWLSAWEPTEKTDAVEYASLLLFDDLGTEHADARVAAKLNLLMDRRWKKKRSTVVTTNLTKEELTASGQQARLLDRLSGRAPWLVVTRESQRTPVRVQDWAEEIAGAAIREAEEEA